MMKREILLHLIYNHHKKFTSLDVFNWAGKEFGHPVVLEEIIRMLHGLVALGFLKEYKARKGSNIPPRYQAEPGHVRKLVEMIKFSE